MILPTFGGFRYRNPELNPKLSSSKARHGGGQRRRAGGAEVRDWPGVGSLGFRDVPLRVPLKGSIGIL